MTTTTVQAACLCRANVFTLEFPGSSLPIPTNICHCWTSRHVSGQLGTSYFTLSTSFIPSLENLKGYNSSDKATRYFCKVCGAHMFWKTTGGPWEATAGILERTEGIVDIKFHQWVGDTGDGGYADFLLALGGKDLARFEKGPNVSGELPVGWRGKGDVREKSNERILKARCHCGGVRFSITRPGEESKKVKSDWPDLLIPYWSSSAENKEDVAWWLRPGNRYLAGTCACRSCRLSSGFEIQTWAFVPGANILLDNGKEIDFNDRESCGTLKRYDSSEGVHREFCGMCGARAFWRGDWRPELIDVSVGLLDAEDGTRAESWLDWHMERVSFAEDAVNTLLVESLKDGLSSWQQKRDM